ncbi:hypothetical protein [Haloferula sp. BvORR071]|uniref:hypothetical protein n=1 Tax=Haloferula sp. BvORR071 TaxID=1396141 RepID=UPI00054DF15D|nr:hypothetical protein [Haloferula sp. BvORR071]
MSWPPAPDRFEKRIRFGCGSITGFLLLGLILLFFIETPEMPGWYLPAVAGGALIAGLLALRFGDKFYHGLLTVLSWITGVGF